MNHKLVISALFCFVLVCNKSIGQYTQSVGLKLSTGGYDLVGSFKGLGIEYEKRVTKHSSFESGIFYKSTTMSGILYYGINNATVRYNYITVPLLYKFSSKIVDISGGLTANYYLGRSAYYNIHADGYGDTYLVEDFNKFHFGGMLKLSKRFNITKQFSIVPDFNINLTKEPQFIEAGILMNFSF